MNEKELLALAIDNLKDSCRDLVLFAESDKHLNMSHKDIGDAYSNIETKLRLVFTLKNAFNQLQRK